MSAVQSYKMDEDMCSPQLQHFPCAAFVHKQESHLPEDDAQQDSPVSPEVTDRALLIHSPVQMRRGWRRRKRHLFLFSDVLLVSNTKYKKSFKIKSIIPLHILSMAECGDKMESGGGRSRKSFVLSWPSEKFKVTFRSSELKERWYSLLQRNINIHREKKLHNIPLQTCADDFQKGGSQESHLPDDDAQQDNPVSPEVTGRALLIHSPVQMRRGWRRRKRHLFLFSDVLLVSNTKYKKSFKMKDMIPLHILSMAECGDKVQSGGGRSKKSFVLSWPSEKFKVTFRSSELKERWYSLLQRYINIHKEKELQNIALQTYANDFQKGGTQERHLPEEETHLERPVTPENDGRALLIHSPVQMQMRSRRKKQHLFLFTDLLLVSNTKYKKCFKMKYVVPLRSLWMAECGDNEKGGDHSRKSLVLGWPMENVKVTFGSSEQKEKWCSFLQRYIGLAKEDPDNSIPLQIFTTEVNNNALPITVIARHSDTVNDVIRKSLSSLKITGSENEYQLWIDSEKREESIALLGHENPYVIKMSQLGVTEFVPRGPSTHEMHNLHSPVLEHWYPPVGFRFVLKPRQPANGKQPNNSEQKREGRGRAFLNWLFGRQSNIAKENLPGKPASPKAGLLFGVSLQAACQDGKLPSAVLDMISFLSQEGELTEGIFRKSGSVKACRALKEKLISGAPVDLHQESVLVVASVLKDFLRNVQGSVFYTPMYETWLGIMDEEDEEEKIILAQSLLEMLPRANQLLLKHLFGMLNQIQKNSSLNLMTSYNLAVCTATSLMAPPPDARAGFDLELMRKVALVQFLIDNTSRIFVKGFSPFW